jgi:hypothetical protein
VDDTGPYRLRRGVEVLEALDVAAAAGGAALAAERRRHGPLAKARYHPASTSSGHHFYHVHEVRYGHSFQMTLMIPGLNTCSWSVFSMITKYFMVIHTK